MKTRDKFLYGFLLLAAVASLVQRLKDGVVFGDMFNTLVSVGVVVVSWFLIIKLLFWIYDRVVGKLRKNKGEGNV